MSKKTAESRLVDWSVFLISNTEKYGYEYEEIERFQLRLTKGKQRIDIFPKSKKFFDITNQVWGEIVTDLDTFIYQRFADKSSCHIRPNEAISHECSEAIAEQLPTYIQDNVLFLNGKRYGPIKTATFVYDGDNMYMQGQSTTVEF